MPYFPGVSLPCKGLEVLGGAEGNRTPDLLIANEALYHLSYGPKEARRYVGAAASSSARLAVVTAVACQGCRGAARSDVTGREAHGRHPQLRLLHRRRAAEPA